MLAIARWAAWMAAKFHDEQTETVKEAKEFKEKFANAIQDAERAEKLVKQTLERAQSMLAKAKEDADYWFKVAMATSWIPFVDIVTLLTYYHEVDKYFEVSDDERKAEKELSETKNKLAKAESDEERAKVITGLSPLIIRIEP